MPHEPQTAAIAVRQIPLEHVEALALIAKAEGLTREQLVRRLIKEIVEARCEPA
jgi:hypothetical protein